MHLFFLDIKLLFSAICYLFGQMDAQKSLQLPYAIACVGVLRQHVQDKSEHIRPRSQRQVCLGARRLF